MVILLGTLIFWSLVSNITYTVFRALNNWLLHEVPSYFNLVLIQDQHKEELKTVCFSKEKISWTSLSRSLFCLEKESKSEVKPLKSTCSSLVTSWERL